jgi:hypothetical protein
MSQLASAQQADQRSWVGTWKLDRTASHFVGFVVTIHRLPHSYRFDLGGTTIEVGDDGKDYVTVPTRSTSFKQIKANQWLRVHKINGKEIDSSVFTLSSDGRSFVIHTVATDDNGEKHESEETFRREGTGTGIDGSWRSDSAGVNIPERLEISASEGGGLRFNYPTDGLSFTTRLNGSPVSYSGAHAVPSVRVAVSSASPTELRRTDFLNGRPYQEGIDILSPDGQKLTEVSWYVSDPADRDEAVYRRQ